MTCLHCQELRDEIAFLKRQLGVEASDRQIDRITTSFRLSPAEARMLAALYNAKGRVVTSIHLDEVAPAVRVHADERNMKHVDVRICRLRKKLGSAETIRNVWGSGYHLTDLGRLIVSEAIEDKPAVARKPLEAA